MFPTNPIYSPIDCFARRVVFKGKSIRQRTQTSFCPGCRQLRVEEAFSATPSSHKFPLMASPLYKNKMFYIVRGRGRKKLLQSH